MFNDSLTNEKHPDETYFSFFNSDEACELSDDGVLHTKLYDLLLHLLLYHLYGMSVKYEANTRAIKRAKIVELLYFEKHPNRKYLSCKSNNLINRIIFWFHKMFEIDDFYKYDFSFTSCKLWSSFSIPFSQSSITALAANRCRD